MYSQPCNCWNQEEKSLHALFKAGFAASSPGRADSGRLSNPLFCIFDEAPSFLWPILLTFSLCFQKCTFSAVHIVATPIWPCSCCCLLPQLFIGLKTCSLSTFDFQLPDPEMALLSIYLFLLPVISDVSRIYDWHFSTRIGRSMHSKTFTTQTRRVMSGCA